MDIDPRGFLRFTVSPRLRVLRRGLSSFNVTAEDQARFDQFNLEREKAWLAILLAWVAGFVDVLGFLTLIHVFTSHMSGNSVSAGANFARGNFSEAGRSASPVPGFVFGVLIGTILGIVAARCGIRRRASIALAVEIACLLAYMLYGSTLLHAGNLSSISVPNFVLLTSLLAFAMGLQNATLRRVRGFSVHTGFVTGMLTQCAEDAAIGLVHIYDWLRRASPDSAARRMHRRRMILAGGVWLTFAVGGMCGGLSQQRWNLHALVLPIAVLAIVILCDFFHPIHE